MRDLILVRGAPGSGKSTWCAQHNLQPYVVSSDAIRQIFSAPDLDPQTGEPHISQNYEQKVWEFIESVVELRMKDGQLIVLDAQNVKPGRWLKLAEKYRYRVWKHEMSTTLDECLERNAKRHSLTKVPDNVIVASYHKIAENRLPNAVKEAPEDLLNGDIAPLNVDEYERLIIAGDIHGCIEPLEKLYEHTNYFQASDLIVFVGDYLDRGLDNKEVLELLVAYKDAPNMIFLEGNHIWEKYWAEDRIDEIRSREFMSNTLPQIQDCDKKAVREWCRRWRQLAYLEFHGRKFFITHAGVGFMPEHPRFVPSRTYIKGASYSDDVDRWWCEHCYGHDLIQVHGHRNWYSYDMEDLFDSVNLCSAVEFGEDWRVYQITKDSDEYIHFPNTKFRKMLNMRRRADILEGRAIATPEERVQILVDNMRGSRGINEKQLPDNISSFNFTRDVFTSGEWDALHLIARGLFIDTLDWRIVARGYSKFFNYNERGSKNTLGWLKENLVFPVKCYRKYNGFLGIMSWDKRNERLFVASKSTNEGDHSKLAWNALGKAGIYEKVIPYLKESDVTMLFEICTPVDPHIISEKEGPVLLDIIDNNIKFSCNPFLEMCEYADNLGIEHKVLDRVIPDWETLEPVLDKQWVMDPGHAIEGWVLKDANGYMFKLKCDYYVRWKKLRTLMNKINEDLVINADAFAPGLTRDIVSFMYRLKHEDKLMGMSIIDVRDAWLAAGGEDYPYKPEES